MEVFKIAPERIDVNAATPGVPSEHGQFFRPASSHNIGEDPFHTHLMKSAVIPKGHHVPKQGGGIDAPARVLYK